MRGLFHIGRRVLAPDADDWAAVAQRFSGIRNKAAAMRDQFQP